MEEAQGIKRSEKEKVLLIKDLFENYKDILNLTTAETHEIEMWLEEKLGGEKNELAR